MLESDDVSLLMLMARLDLEEGSKGNSFRKERPVDFVDDSSDFGEMLFRNRHRSPGLGNGILGRLFWKERHDTERSAMLLSLQPFFQSSPIALVISPKIDERKRYLQVD